LTTESAKKAAERPHNGT